MINLHRPDGQAVSVAADDVIWARPSLSNEIYNRPGHDGAVLFLAGSDKQIVLESIIDVGSALSGQDPHFIALQGLSGRTFWVDARQADAPRLPKPFEISDSNQDPVACVVDIGGAGLKLIEPIEDVQIKLTSAA